jgi:fermentation-respiration switch protein FrsA (DUF1100 family)
VSRRVRWLLLLLALMVPGMLGLVWLQRRLLYPGALVGAPARPPVEAEVGHLATDQAPVEWLFLPGDGVSEEAPGPVVLFAHGNGEIVDLWVRPLAPYRRLGVSVAMAEYRGYGRTGGSPTEARLTADFRALRERVAEDPRVDPARVVVHGRSLGGGVVCSLLRTRPPAAVVLESTFTSIPDIAAGMRVPGFLLVERWESERALRAYDGPVLVFHGLRDQVVPVEHGRRLAEAAQTEPVLYRAGHNDLPPTAQEADYWDRIEAHLRQAGVLRP